MISYSNEKKIINFGDQFISRCVTISIVVWIKRKYPFRFTFSAAAFQLPKLDFLHVVVK